MEGEQEVQQAQEEGALEVGCSEQEEKLQRIVRQGFSRLLLLDVFVKLHFFDFVAQLKERCDAGCSRALGPRTMAEGDEEARAAWLAMVAFPTRCGLRPVSEDVYSKLRALLSMLRRTLLSPFPGFCKLACLLAQQRVHLAAPTEHLKLLEQISQALREHASLQEAADNMILPVMTLQAVLDLFALRLGALRLREIYAELRAKRKCGSAAAAEADTLADETWADLHDALNLLSQPGYASSAVRLVLDWVQISRKVRAFLEELATSDNAKEKMGEFVVEFTDEQMGLVCEAAACCCAALNAMLEAIRNVEFCGPHYDTLVLTCAAGYDPALVNLLYVYLEIGRHTATGVLALAALHEGLGSELGRWAAALVERRFEIAALFDEDYSASLCKGRSTTVMIADSLQCFATGVQMQFKEVRELQEATDQRVGVLEQQQEATDQRVGVLEQQVAAERQRLEQQLAAERERADAADRRADTMQEAFAFSLALALQQKPLTPVRQGKVEAMLSSLTIGGPAAVEPIPFGSRIASPEPEEQQQQPESSAAASSRTAPVGAAEPAAAEPTAGEPAAAAPSAVGAAGSRPAGVTGGGQAAGRGDQAARRPPTFGMGRHAAERGNMREAVRWVQQAAAEQARQDQQTYGNPSGLRVRHVGGSQGGSTVTVASSAYSRPLQPPPSVQLRRTWH